MHGREVVLGSFGLLRRPVRGLLGLDQLDALLLWVLARPPGFELLHVVVHGLRKTREVPPRRRSKGERNPLLQT